ncbi:BCL2 modifying factor 2 [Lates calcarifer]|uniref:BCL2 modifying factor 2 n=1 Tax=Lates calcarifer TaxID=8187 RepID=A0A4W6BWW5_LATCA|nr:BCL2 modifying factor 2 [Lates calcarifer]XP_018549987.1 BCL2 modifying factor 2 [Lates calcarifer]
MDDEEEDMSRPISQLWGTPFRDVKYEDRSTPITAGQALAAVTAAVPTSQSHNNNNNSISINTLPCSLHWQPRVPFHGNAGLRSHFPAHFEPMEDRGERQIEEEEEEEGRGEEDDRMAERPEEQAGVSVEAQIGRKLREIGDKFQQDHVELFMRHHRQNLPIWMRLTMALFGFLFPREAVIPRLRGEQR